MMKKRKVRYEKKRIQHKRRGIGKKERKRIEGGDDAKGKGKKDVEAKENGKKKQ